MSYGSATIDRYQRRCGGLVSGAVGLMLVALGGRLVFINTTLRPRLAAIADQQQQGSSVIPARRGMILDARGRVVAVSRQMPDVFVDPALVDDVDELSATLGARLNLPSAQIADRIRRRSVSRFTVVSRQVDEVTAEAVREMQSPAVGLLDGAVRAYPLGESMAHVLGTVGRDGRGLEGIELAYDHHLSGIDGRRSTIRDAARRALWRSARGEVPPADGGHLVLTIDSEIQRLAETELAGTVAEFEAASGVAIVMCPKDGRILAMACRPAFDPSRLSDSATADRRNRAVTDPVEPGSAFKPIIAGGALDGGFVSKTELIDCRMGSHFFGERLVTDTSPCGMMDLEGILTKSSNIGMGQIAGRMGNKALHDTIRRFGFGEPTGIDYPGESNGIVHPLDRWTDYSTVSVSFGYEVAVTPLQLISAFGALVNDGILLRPRLVQALLGPDGHVAESFDRPMVIRRAVSSEVARYMSNEVLVSVVENGGGKRAQTGAYRVLGKTGTAKLLATDRRAYEDGAYLATFVGASPVLDPQLVTLVMIRRPNPGIGYYGSQVAAPAVGRILEGTLSYWGVSPDRRGRVAGL